MRTHIAVMLPAVLIAAAAVSQERVALPDGTPAVQVIERQAPRIQRTEAETAQPIMVLADAREDKAEPPAYQPGDAPPPPAMNEPAPAAAPPTSEARNDDPVTLEDAVPDAGEKVLPSSTTPDTPITPAPHRTGKDAPLPEKARGPDEIAPAVTIRSSGDLTVEEYRREGKLYMVRFVPKKGIPYTYMDTDGDGRLEGDPNDGPVQPVYYTIYEWQ